MTTLKCDNLTKIETLSAAAIEDSAPALAEARSLIDRFQSIARREAMADLAPQRRVAELSLIASFAHGVAGNFAAVRVAVTKP